MSTKLSKKIKKARLETDSLQNLIIQYTNEAEGKARVAHKRYIDFLTKHLGHTRFEVTNVYCNNKDVLGHVYTWPRFAPPKSGLGLKKCIFCGCDDFDF